MTARHGVLAGCTCLGFLLRAAAAGQGEQQPEEERWDQAVPTSNEHGVVHAGTGTGHVCTVDPEEPPDPRTRSRVVS